MKKFVFSFLLITSNLLSYAQWTAGPGNINNTNTGNIGIGTTAPKSLVEMRKDVGGGQGPVLELTNGVGGANASSEIYFSTYDRGSGSPSARIKVSDNALWGGNISFDTKGNSGSAPLYSRLFINGASGNVGIGTSTPDYKFTVYGGNFKVIGIGNDNNYFMYNGGGDLVLRSADRGVGGRALVHDVNNSLTVNYGGDYTGGTKIGSNTFFAEGTSGVSYVNGGGLAIGTNDAKGYKLAVNGSVIATSVTVKVYPWPDFVFKRDYKLQTLNEINTYINQNHHLPEIPSEKENTANGLNLGQMNSLLLKKVEELTLYLIKQDNRIKRLELQRKKSQRGISK
jgi:hypothetical protein